MFVTMVLILIFGEVLGLYGYVCHLHLIPQALGLMIYVRLIVALIMNSHATEARCT